MMKVGSLLGCVTGPERISVVGRWPKAEGNKDVLISLLIHD